MVVGLSFATLLGFSALAVDVGMVRVAGTQLQAAVDAATFSASSELDGTTTGITKARARAISIAAANHVLDGTVTLTTAEVEVGTYDDGVFTLWDGHDPSGVNAVRIDHQPPQIGSVLGSVAFGVAGYDIEARSMAVRPTGGGPASSTECFLPLAIPDCWVRGTPAGTNPHPLKFTFSPSPTDSIAWGDPDGNPNSNDVRNQLLGQCDHDAIEVGDPIFSNEGSHTTALQTIKNVLNNAAAIPPGRWNASLYGPMPARSSSSAVTGPHWGNTLEGPVALVDAGSNCSAVSFTGSKPMTGVAWAVIFDVKDTGGSKYITVQLDLVNEHDIWGEIDDGAVGKNVLGNGDPQLVTW